MARITAKGKTDYGVATVEVIGDKTVREIKCDKPLLKGIIEGDIRTRANLVANYAPPSGSMLQAYATLCRYFDYNDVKTEGDIGTIPSTGEKGVIY